MNLNQDDFYTGQELANIYRNILEHGLPSGYTTGLSNLDELFRLDKGRVAVVTGVPSNGKSTFVNFLCAKYNIEHRLKCVIYTPETSADVYITNFCKAFQKEGDYNFPYYIAENFMFLKDNKSYDINTLIEKFEEKYVKTSYDIMVIDSYSTLSYSRPANMSETEYISYVMDVLTRFARTYNILVIMIAHPKKMAKDTINGGYEEPAPYDISGSANFYNKADFCITVHRVWENGKPTCITKVTANKVKTANYGRIGTAYLGFDPDLSSYCDVDLSQPKQTYASASNMINNAFAMGVDPINVIYGNGQIPMTPKVEIQPLNFIYTIKEAKQPDYWETELNYFDNIANTTPQRITFKDLITLQANEEIREKVDVVRKEEDKKKQSELKAKLLPCVAFNARFHGNRAKDNISEYTNLIYIDIDYKDNVNIMPEVPDILKRIDNILLYQRSAGGKGYMAVMPTDTITDASDFLSLWRAAEKEFRKLGITIDTATKDASRVTFISHDTDYYINPNAIPFKERYKEVPAKKSPKPRADKPKYHTTYTTHSPNTDNETLLRQYINEANARHLDICPDYEAYRNVGIACLQEFGYDKAKEYFPQLCRYNDTYDYDTTLADLDKWHTYEGNYTCNFGTLKHYFDQAITANTTN